MPLAQARLDAITKAVEAVRHTHNVKSTTYKDEITLIKDKRTNENEEEKKEANNNEIGDEELEEYAKQVKYQFQY